MHLDLTVNSDKHGQGYPPAWDETVQEFKVDCTKDVVDLLREGDISPGEINTVIYRYVVLPSAPIHRSELHFHTVIYTSTTLETCFLLVIQRL